LPIRTKSSKSIEARFSHVHIHESELHLQLRNYARRENSGFLYPNYCCDSSPKICSRNDAKRLSLQPYSFAYFRVFRSSRHNWLRPKAAPCSQSVCRRHLHRPQYSQRRNRTSVILASRQ
jgi:hypothetical protein